MSNPQPGRVAHPEPGLRQILAPNPSPMTHWGTNTYIVGSGQVAVIDPGPANLDHLQAILRALTRGETISHILVTHPHLDHSPLAALLSDATGAPIYGFGPPTAGRTRQMHDLAALSIGGGEGVDHAYTPHLAVSDGDMLTGPNWQLRAMHTPGHFAGHLSFAWGERLFSGDHIMGWASSLISPPDGDMGQYMASLHRLAAQTWSRIYPGHGAPVDTPAGRIHHLIQHRHARETALLSALSQGASTLPALTAIVYADTPKNLLAVASRNLLAHLIDLKERNLIDAAPGLALDAHFKRI